MSAFFIEGAAVQSITSFYREINRVFMTDEDWRLGESLDALNDLLYGGVGALRGADEVRVVWREHAQSRHALGREATLAYYCEKLRHPSVFSAPHFEALIAELERGTGATYFDIVLEIFADHPEIDLVLS